MSPARASLVIPNAERLKARSLRDVGCQVSLLGLIGLAPTPVSLQINARDDRCSFRPYTNRRSGRAGMSRKHGQAKQPTTALLVFLLRQENYNTQPRRILHMRSTRQGRSQTAGRVFGSPKKCVP